MKEFELMCFVNHHRTLVRIRASTLGEARRLVRAQYAGSHVVILWSRRV
jgi:hypothetical protein